MTKKISGNRKSRIDRCYEVIFLLRHPCTVKELSAEIGVNTRNTKLYLDSVKRSRYLTLERRRRITGRAGNLPYEYYIDY